MAVAGQIHEDFLAERITAADLRDLADHLGDQTVVRDFKLIAQSDMVVVLYPSTKVQIVDETGKAVPAEHILLSAGVLSEMVHAFNHEKDVFAVWEPTEQPSPFFSYHCKKWARTKEELLEYFRSLGLIQ